MAETRIIARNKWVLQADTDPAAQIRHARHQNQLKIVTVASESLIFSEKGGGEPRASIAV